jgi:hypothetical protein
MIDQPTVIDSIKATFDVGLQHPLRRVPFCQHTETLLDGICR